MDRSQLEQLYRDHADYLRNVCRRKLRNPADAEDVVQEAFRRVARRPMPENPQAYLAVVASRVITEFATKQVPTDDRMIEVADPDGHREQDELLTRMALERIFNDTNVFLTIPEQRVFRMRLAKQNGQADLDTSAALLGITKRTLRLKLEQAVTAAHLYAAVSTGELSCGELAKILSGDEQPDKKRAGVTKHWRNCGTCDHHVSTMIGRITAALAAIPAVFLGVQAWRQASAGVLSKVAAVAALGIACATLVVRHDPSIEPSPADAAPGVTTTSVQPPVITSPPRTTAPATGQPPRATVSSSEKPFNTTTSPQPQSPGPSSQPSITGTVRIDDVPPSITAGDNVVEHRRITTVNPNRCGDSVPGTSLVRVRIVSPSGVVKVTLIALLHGRKTVREMASSDGTTWFATVGAYPDGTDAGTVELTVVAEGGNGAKTGPKKVGEICLRPCG